MTKLKNISRAASGIRKNSAGSSLADFFSRAKNKTSAGLQKLVMTAKNFVTSSTGRKALAGGGFMAAGAGTYIALEKLADSSWLGGSLASAIETTNQRVDNLVGQQGVHDGMDSKEATAQVLRRLSTAFSKASSLAVAKGLNSTEFQGQLYRAVSNVGALATTIDGEANEVFKFALEDALMTSVCGVSCTVADSDAAVAPIALSGGSSTDLDLASIMVLNERLRDFEHLYN